MPRRRPALGVALACAIAALGCSSASDTPPAPAAMHIGGQTGGEAGIRCSSDVSASPLAFDAESPLGFSARDLAQSLPKSAARPLAWTDGSSAVLDLTLSYTQSAGYADSCRSNAAEVTLTLVSSDGALAETTTTRLFSNALGRASLDANLELSTLTGSLSREHGALLERAVALLVQIDFDATSASGRLLAVNDDGSTEIAAF